MKYTGGEAAGTGMVLTSDGEVVTNHHVVAGATSIKAKVMSTGKTYTAEVVGTDAKDDVAVLQLVGASGLSTVTPDTDGIAVGDAVTAVGDANGTVELPQRGQRHGARPRARRSPRRPRPNVSGERLTGLLQISSDVISGDSGGATYDADGEVVGMTTAASSGSSDVVGLRRTHRQGAADRRRPGQRGGEAALRLRSTGVPRGRARRHGHDRAWASTGARPPRRPALLRGT